MKKWIQPSCAGVPGWKEPQMLCERITSRSSISRRCCANESHHDVQSAASPESGGYLRMRHGSSEQDRFALRPSSALRATKPTLCYRRSSGLRSFRVRSHRAARAAAPMRGAHAGGRRSPATETAAAYHWRAARASRPVLALFSAPERPPRAWHLPRLRSLPAAGRALCPLVRPGAPSEFETGSPDARAEIGRRFRRF